MIRWLAAFACLAASPALAIELDLPVACTPGTDCWIVHYVDHGPGPGVADSFCGQMTYDGHKGIDFAIPDKAAMRRGVDVLAAADGIVKAVRDRVPDIAVEEGGKAAVAGIDCGNGLVVDDGDGWETQYCHMRRGSIVVRPGDKVTTGDRLGLVGLSGMTSFPHLHLSVRKDGLHIDPFHGTSMAQACGVDGPSLWNAATAKELAYQPLALTKLGIADGPVDADAVWDGRADVADLTSHSPALVAFMGAFGMQADDKITLTLTDPSGTKVVDGERVQPRDQARVMMFAGRKQPDRGWVPGTWQAAVLVMRDGKPYRLERSFEVAP